MRSAPFSSPLASLLGSSRTPLTSSVPLRIVATAVAGGALAAAGQQALDSSLPAVIAGATSTTGLYTAGAATVDPAPAPAPGAQISDITQQIQLSGVAGVAAPPVADAAGLVKAADLNLAAQQAAEQQAAAQKVAAEKAAAAKAAADRAAADAAAQPAAVAGGAGGAVQLIAGRVTSGFGARWGTVHQGLDIAAPIGTPVRVPLGGTVISSGPASGFGLWVRVRHADGTISVYGHINRSLVTVGQEVAAGDVIAESGNRGQSTGPHLHIGVMQDGRYVNPKPWLDANGVQY